jgi:hypothetical protein
MFVTWNQVFVPNTTRVSSAFLNYVRLSIGATIDAVGGSNGSVHTPVTIIDIGGAGFRVRTDFYTHSTSTFHGDGFFDQQGDAALTGETTITDCVSFTASGPMAQSGNLATFAKRVNTTTILNSAAVQNIDATIADVFIIPNGHTNDLDIRPKLTAPVPPDGCVVRFTREGDSSGGRHAQFNLPVGTNLVRLNAGGAGFIELVFYGGAWHYSASGGEVTGAGNTVIGVPS